MTWICDFGVVNCPVCQRAKETIKSLSPNLPDKIIDKALREQKIDLHKEKIEQVSIEIIAGGEPKIEIKTNKDRKPNNPINVPSFVGTIWETKTADNTDPWDSIIGMDDIATIPWSTIVKEGNPPPTFTSIGPLNIDFEPDGSSFLGWPSYPSDYQIIGRPKDEVQKVNKLVPTSKLYKDMKNNDIEEMYRIQGIKSYVTPDGKKTLIVDRKSEIQFQ